MMQTPRENKEEHLVTGGTEFQENTSIIDWEKQKNQINRKILRSKNAVHEKYENGAASSIQLNDTKLMEDS